MNINGLQKLTLLDFPGHTACTVFLAGCDMRCPFCHNSELIDVSADVIMTDEELLTFLKGRQGLLDGVAFTGGEPLLRKELPDLLKEVKALGFATKLDTNGAHPKALKSILDARLVDYVAMDIKNSPEKYPQTSGKANLDITKIKESIEIIMYSGVDYEFRTTVVDQLHDESSFIGIGQLIKGAKRYFLQAFTDRDTVVYSGFSAPAKETMEKYAEIVRKNVKNVEIRGL
ncbi:MAG: anaerobic ribonucleoside-triphosphate reductase activating protein [Bacillota bacterium]|nr:anaerobic ribonucleoside-triphosphate reductase activating protein [Bacillota bacterium]